MNGENRETIAEMNIFQLDHRFTLATSISSLMIASIYITGVFPKCLIHFYPERMTLRLYTSPRPVLCQFNPSVHFYANNWISLKIACLAKRHWFPSNVLWVYNSKLCVCRGAGESLQTIVPVAWTQHGSDRDVKALFPDLPQIYIRKGRSSRWNLMETSHVLFCWVPYIASEPLRQIWGKLKSVRVALHLLI